jgi:carboxymethylenebutenolidase
MLGDVEGARAMNVIGRYLAEEVAVDYADGLISRREATRRLALLGVDAAIATSMLAACEVSGDPRGSATGNGAAPAGPTPTQVESVQFPGPGGRSLRGAWAAAAAPRGSVLVIHEDHIRSVAGRFATSGYAALAIDLLSEEGGTASFSDPAEATAALNAAPAGRFVADLRAGVDELIRRAPDRKVGTIGFCFGGAMVWSLLAAGEPRLSAAAPFYGPLPEGADFAGSPNAAVLGVYAEQDGRVNATREAAEAALQKAGLAHEIITLPGVNHAFFNDTGGRYDAAAAAEAYRRVLDWFGRHLG